MALFSYHAKFLPKVNWSKGRAILGLYFENNMKKYAERFYKGKAWQDCRNAYIKVVGGLCEECLKNGIVSAATEVHHIEHITPLNIDDPNITLNFKNLKALCHQCHMNQHKTGHESRFVVDEFGNVSPSVNEKEGIS